LLAISPSDAQLVAAIEAAGSHGEAVIFACERYLKECQHDGSHVIQVHCIARVDESLMIAAIAAGASAVQLVEGACAGCPQSSGQKVATSTAASANSLLQAWGRPALVQLVTEAPQGEALPDTSKQANEPAVAAGVSRREFFSRLRGEGAEVASGALAQVVGAAVTTSGEAAQQVLPLAEYPRHVPVRRWLLLASLARLGEPLAPEAEPGIWGSVQIGTECTGCYGCVDFCPSGALAKFEHEGQAGIAFRSARCTHCRLCEDICGQAMQCGCLHVSPVIRWQELLQEETTVVMLKDKSSLYDPEEKPQDKLSKLLGADVSSYGS
jgi:ferredoxin